ILRDAFAGLLHGDPADKDAVHSNESERRGAVRDDAGHDEEGIEDALSGDGLPPPGNGRPGLGGDVDGPEARLHFAGDLQQDAEEGGDHQTSLAPFPESLTPYACRGSASSYSNTRSFYRSSSIMEYLETRP